ncbi:hypothetical protein UY3_01685 [Chelonia mydas]|uniref:Uncharacterized protein n=1 Tax=Chelonia mydas TaxID=8469 RepID=M7BT62_CHEMY|nr:hypothetical protein UY3_01685 [Chelonia mydas]
MGARWKPWKDFAVGRHAVPELDFNGARDVNSSTQATTAVYAPAYARSSNTGACEILKIQPGTGEHKKPETNNESNLDKDPWNKEGSCQSE